MKTTFHFIKIKNISLRLRFPEAHLPTSHKVVSPERNERRSISTREKKYDEKANTRVTGRKKNYLRYNDSFKDRSSSDETVAPPSDNQETQWNETSHLFYLPDPLHFPPFLPFHRISLSPSACPRLDRAVPLMDCPSPLSHPPRSTWNKLDGTIFEAGEHGRGFRERIQENRVPVRYRFARSINVYGNRQG